MADYTAVVYHATKEFPGNGLLSSGKKAIQEVTYLPYQILSGTVSKSPGNLGYGFYTFVDDAELATVFGNKFSGKTAVLRLIIQVPEENVMFLDKGKEERIKLRKWLSHPQTQKAISTLRKFHGNKFRNTNVQKSLDGAVLALFCYFLEQSGNARVDTVQSVTHTAIDDLPNSSSYPMVPSFLSDPQTSFSS